MLFVRRLGAAHALSALRACRRLLVEVKIPLDLPPCEVRRVGEEGASEDVGDSWKRAQIRGACSVCRERERE